MGCKAGDELKEKFAEATKAWGQYDESLQGVARTLENRRHSEQLEKETDVAGIAYEAHRERCDECR